MSNTTKCPFCDEKIDIFLDVCPFCAEELPKDEKIKQPSKSLQSPTEENQKKLTKCMDIANQIKNHLEFIGFSIDDIERNQDNENLSIVFVAIHEKRSNITINILAENVIFIRVRYNWQKNNNSDTLFKAYENINKANSQSFLTRWFYSVLDDGNSIITIEFLLREYQKKAFWRDIELMEEEIFSYIWLFGEDN